MCKKIISTVISFIMVITIFIGTTQEKTVHAESNTDNNVTIERLAGVDRYKTAVEICQKGWNDKSEYAVLANGENFPDALSAAPLAKKYNAPILLTSKDVLNEDTRSELQRLNVKQVLIIGGSGVISENVESTLNSMNIKVKRLYGKDRYETSIKVAEEVGLNNNGVFVVSGENFPDALSVAPIAAQKGMPIILVPKNNLTESTDKYVFSNPINKSYVIGNTNSISEGIVSKFKNTERIYGQNRYATNVAVIEKFENDLNFSGICVANGENFPDGLSGSVLAATGKEPILLVNEQVDESTKVLVNKKSSLLKEVRVLGGSAVVSDGVTEGIRTNFQAENYNIGENNGNIKVGDYVLFGKYCGQPILWKCVDKSNGTMLVSEYILCDKAFDAPESGIAGEGSDPVQTMGSNVWSNSNLREWLNSEDTKVIYSTTPPTKKAVYFNAYADEAGFLTNFTQNETDNILPVKHDDVTDKVFILSKDEVKSCLGSDWKENLKTHRNSTDYWDYWTRTPKSGAKFPIGLDYVYGNNVLAGSAGAGFVNNGDGGVVPALKLKSDICKSGKGSKSDPYVLDPVKISGGCGSETGNGISVNPTPI